jgi:hypothetical protein
MMEKHVEAERVTFGTAQQLCRDFLQTAAVAALSATIDHNCLML